MAALKGRPTEPPYSRGPWRAALRGRPAPGSPARRRHGYGGSAV